MGTLLIACPSCSCHAFARETHCPACGSALREIDGSVQRTAGAVLLGLTIAAGTACGSDVTGGSGGGGGQGGAVASTGMVATAVSAYGVGPGGGFSTTATTSTGGGMGGASVTSSSVGMGGFQAVSAYGVGASGAVGPGGGMSTGSTSGSGGSGG